ncbi:acetyl-CoA carboxylase, biotin carboxyl carrier protein, partial [Fusobacterium ulcerans]|uniref:acetyl-CoA carboxylase, biotin carboxyl carrier protein n=2 Tax=Fusobacterium TaxID=848 RepID=UPI0026F2630C
MKIDLKTIKDLAENIEKYNLNEVVIESEGAKVTLKKEIPAAVETVTAVQRAAVVQNVETAAVEEIVEAAVETEEMETINSPMVGTFYKSSAPGNPAFIAEG